MKLTKIVAVLCAPTSILLILISGVLWFSQSASPWVFYGSSILCATITVATLELSRYLWNRSGQRSELL